MSKKILALVLMVAMLAALVAGCASTATTAAPAETAAAAETTAAAATEKIKIGYSMSQFDDKFLSYLLDAAKAQAATYTDVEVIFTDAKNDSATQLSQLEQFVVQGVKAIVVNPVDTDATEAYTKLAKDAGIPIISVNRVMKNQADATSYVGSDSYISGKLEMEYMGEIMKGEGNIVILRGEDSNEAARLRTQAVKDVIAEKYPNIKILAEDTGKWQRDLGMNIVQNWLAKKDIADNLTAVIANNDEMALGAVKALEAAGKTGVLVAGIDANPDAIDAVIAGQMACTVFQDAAGQGAGAVDAAVKAAKGETIEKLIDIPYVLVKPEDAPSYK